MRLKQALFLSNIPLSHPLSLLHPNPLSLTLGGRQKSEKLAINQLISHLERNFGNIVMLVSKSLDTLSDVFGKNKAKAGEEKAIKVRGGGGGLGLCGSLKRVLQFARAPELIY